MNQSPTEYQQRLQDAAEQLETKTRRGNALLSHLLARLGQPFVDSSLLLYDKQTHRKPVIRLGEKSQESHRGFHLEDKLAFLHAYPTLSAARGGAFDYTQASWETSNISGLKRRLCALLGIKAVTTTEIQEEGFHLVEHLLLRPRSLPQTPTTAYWQFLGSPIARFSPSPSYEGRTVCHAQSHGLQKEDDITISNTANYNGHYQIKWVNQHAFHIEKRFVEEKMNQGHWTLNIVGHDPYSLQLSVVLPDWPVRFQENNFKKLLYDTLISEVPAHVMIYVHWFDRNKMKAFEAVYQSWLAQKSKETPVAWEKALKLLELLRMGKAI
ncbi:MAG: hypothetical protein HamCj_00850 [Candidatus Hamiltonella defensa (Ceratovacuna japonica)]